MNLKEYANVCRRSDVLKMKFVRSKEGVISVKKDLAHS